MTQSQMLPAKSWEGCPTRDLFASRLVRGKCRREDAVFVWDFSKDDERYYINIDVGVLPAGGFTDFGATATDRARWSDWLRQWNNWHGGGLVPGWMKPSEMNRWAYTPERMFAQWIFRGKISSNERLSVGGLLSRRIEGFSVTDVDNFVKELESSRDQDS